MNEKCWFFSTYATSQLDGKSLLGMNAPCKEEMKKRLSMMRCRAPWKTNAAEMYTGFVGSRSGA